MVLPLNQRNHNLLKVFNVACSGFAFAKDWVKKAVEVALEAD